MYSKKVLAVASVAMVVIIAILYKQWQKSKNGRVKVLEVVPGPDKTEVFQSPPMAPLAESSPSLLDPCHKKKIDISDSFEKAKSGQKPNDPLSQRSILELQESDLDANKMIQSAVFPQKRKVIRSSQPLDARGPLRIPKEMVDMPLLFNSPPHGELIGYSIV